MLQNSAEWLKLRKSKIGASDANIIMGVSNYGTPLSLYEEKISKEIVDSSSYITDQGHKEEIKIREWFNLYANNNCEPTVAVLENSFLMASLDGWDAKNRTLIECKLVGDDDFERVKSGEHLDQYYPQLQQQMIIADVESMFLVVCKQIKDENKKVIDRQFTFCSVARDDAYFYDVMFPRLKEFYECVQNKKPPKESDKDYKKLKGFKDKAQRYLELKMQIESLSNELDDIKKELLSAAKADGHPRLSAGALKIIKSVRKGNVDYKKIPELKGVDLEKYRGKETEIWTVK